MILYLLDLQRTLNPDLRRTLLVDADYEECCQFCGPGVAGGDNVTRTSPLPSHAKCLTKYSASFTTTITPFQLT